jgi:cellulose synthase/poly-beta-1,6-N-acetylglucosamine synthase-like glycosyltransferase/putative flippase GtrA
VSGVVRDRGPHRLGLSTELIWFAAVGGTVAVVGALILEFLTSRAVTPGVANAVQAVITLQLSFLGNDSLTYRSRVVSGPLGWRARWARYQVARVGVLASTAGLFVPVERVVGQHGAYWLMLAAGAIANFAVDRTISHRRTAPAGRTVRWLNRHHRFRAVLGIAAGICTLILVAGIWTDGSILLAALAMLLVSTTTLAFQLYGWRTPESGYVDKLIVPSEPSLRVAVFLAARKEATVLSSTLQRMANLDHPNYFVGVIVDHRDDPDTLAIARDFAERHPEVIRVLRYPDVPTSSKPIALNEAMRQLVAGGERWDVVGVADAEDRFHADLLRTVDHLFRTTGAGIVQGAVQLVNFSTRHAGHHLPDGYLVALYSRLRGRPAGRTPTWLVRLDRTPRLRRRLQYLCSGWWRAANCLEYFKWFSSRLKLQAAVRVMPLGGNTVFFTREFMAALHDYTGMWWDEGCLTEDCKIGFVASVLDFKVEVFSVPQLATLEETPATLAKFVRQRVRWMQGFVQVFIEGEWHKLPTLSQRLMAIYILGFQFFQAFTGVIAPIGLVLAFTHKSPTIVVLVSLLPFIVSLWNVVLDLVMLRDFGRAFAPVDRGRRSGRRGRSGVGLLDYVGLAFGSYLFQFVLSLSAIGAIYRSLAGITNWVKTDHAGAYLTQVPEPSRAGA